MRHRALALLGRAPRLHCVGYSGRCRFARTTGRHIIPEGLPTTRSASVKTQRHLKQPESPAPMPLLGTAILAVWNEVDPEIEPDFNDWYLREHIPERLSVPGMNRGRRYRADAGTPRYMAFYEAASMDVLTQGPYRTQLDNPTAWTQRIMPHFRFAQRGLCDVAVSIGRRHRQRCRRHASDPGRRAAIAQLDHRKACCRNYVPARTSSPRIYGR